MLEGNREERLLQGMLTGEEIDFMPVGRKEKLLDSLRKNGTAQLNDIANSFNVLNLDDSNVNRSVSAFVNDAIVRQEYLGGYIEVQPDSWDGEIPATDSTSKTWGFPMSLLPAEQAKIKDMILAGNGKNIMYIRLPLGFGYRGYRNIDDTSKLAKNIGERFAGQNKSLKAWFDNISLAGGGLAAEYWCPAPHWVTSGSYNGKNQLWAGGSNARSVTLASIKSTDKTQYDKQIADFTDAIIDDLEYLHQNVAPVRMFSLQNEPKNGEEIYGGCGYDAQTYNDVLNILVPKIKASTILSKYNDEANEVKLLVASSDETDPFKGIAKTFITNHSNWIWGYTHHSMRLASGEGDTAGADWYKGTDFRLKKGGNQNVFINEYEYFSLDFKTPEYRCSNNMLRLINEAIYGEAKVLHPVIHICKPLGQTLASTNTKGYCLFETNLKGDFGVSPLAESNEYRLGKGTAITNAQMYNSWAMFGDNLPIGAYLVGNYTNSKIDNAGYCIYKYNGKMYIFMANNSDKDAKITLTFKDKKTFGGKLYDLKHCGNILKDKEGLTIDFVIPAYSGQCWIEKFQNESIIEPKELEYEHGGADSTTGADTTDANKIRTGFIEVDKNPMYIRTDVSLSTMSHVVRFYDKDKKFLASGTNGLYDVSGREFNHEIPSAAKYIKILFLKAKEAPSISGEELQGEYVVINDDLYKLKLKANA